MRSAVLFIIFKRPDTTRRVFERIREAQPPRLYIAADGPRKDRSDEIEKCKAARKIVEVIDWPCEVHRLYRDENLGCGKGVSSAITWFFEHEEQGIIIEDDILPHIDFFRYCDEMLDRYKDDERIQEIGGHNTLYNGYSSDAPYYLSNFQIIWGWASWKRVWDTYVYDINMIPREKLNEKFINRVPQKTCEYFMRIYDKMSSDGIDTWDYQLYFNQILHNRYAIVPYVNMTRNIGFDSLDAAHTSGPNSKELHHIERTPYPFVHPEVLFEDKDADKIRINNSHFFMSSPIRRLCSKILSIIKACL